MFWLRLSHVCPANGRLRLPFKVTALHCKQKQSDGPRVYMSFNRRENMTQLARLFTVKHLQERVAERFLFDLKGFKVHLKHCDSHLRVACGWSPNCSNIKLQTGMKYIGRLVWETKTQCSAAILMNRGWSSFLIHWFQPRSTERQLRHFN